MTRVGLLGLDKTLDKYLKSCGMNNFQRALRHKNSSAIDEKIARLDEMMTTTDMYVVTKQDNGVNDVPPTFGDAPLGDLGQDDFEWPDQGDGSDPDDLYNFDELTSEDALGRNLPIYDYLPGITHNRWDRNPDYSIYPDGKPPYAILYDTRALASTRYFVLNEDGLHFVIQIGTYTTPGPYTTLQTEISNFVSNIPSGLQAKPVFIWGALEILLGQYYAASQYFPSDRSITTDPVAERGLYQYMMYVPATGNSNYALDAGIRTSHVRVTDIISRDDLGDPNYYPGEVAGLDPYTLKEMLDEYQSPYTPAYMKRNIMDALDKWAKPGSPNRMRLKNMGIPLV